VRLHRDPLSVLQRCQRTYGDLFTLRLVTAGPVVAVTAEQAASAVVGGDPVLARAGEARRTVLPMASPLSVFGADGSEHLNARRRIAPLFSPESLAASEAEIAAIAARHLACWPRRRPFRLLPRMRAFADDVFVHVVLGISAEPRADMLAQAIGRMLRTPGNPPVSVPAPEDGLLGRFTDLMYRRRRAPVARLLQAEIELRRRSEEPGAGVLGALLAEEPERGPSELIDELLALLMAAQEPMAAALTWIVLRAHERADVLARLREEGARSCYAEAVVAEVLRLQPPALASLRRTSSSMQIDGYQLPEHTALMVPIPLLHRDQRRFPDAETFRPERHLAPEHEQQGWMLPFGGGARQCVAPALARVEIAAMLEGLLERLSLRLLGDQPERMVLRATILVPQRGGLAVAFPR
jgi:cytochrome P450